MLIQIGTTYVNTAHILTVQHSRTNCKEHEQCYHHTLTVELIGGERVRCGYESAGRTPWELDEIEQVLRPTVAAAAGFYVLQFYDEPEGDDPGYSKREVVAWSRVDDYMEPLCTETIAHGGGNYAILYPDGRVTVPDSAIYPSFAEWHAVELAAHKAKQAQERSAAST